MEETASLAEDNYSDILAQLLLRLASCVRLQPEGDLDPLGDAVSAFKQFLERTESTYITEALDESGGWHLFSNELDNNHAFTIVVAQICQHKPDIVCSHFVERGRRKEGERTEERGWDRQARRVRACLRVFVRLVRGT